MKKKKLKTPVVILIEIWETETNPHSNVHRPHVLPSSNALVEKGWAAGLKVKVRSRAPGSTG
ncbi:hypothetical protein E2C01_033575 [Portunus trituberculatus]|uniref:Uncharacterized protein n=1 Tax=Portunus trituberculatus TaxID=210409 RepID=A0A5B7EYA2_PORTR|nr:hypothetical protein [Portunus trituberculatus]